MNHRVHTNRGRRRWPALVGGLAVHSVMGLLLISSAEKAIDIDSFVASLHDWRLPDGVPTIIVAFIVINAQLLLAGLWFLNIKRRAVVIAATSMLSLYSAYYSWLSIDGTPPQCNCIHLIDQYFQSKHAARYIMIRNTILVCVLVGGWTLTRRCARQPIAGTPSPRPADSIQKHHRSTQPGFTIVELVLVIAIVGVLASLIIPAASKARGSSQLAVVLSSMRSHVAIFQQYTTDWNDRLPYFASPTATETIIRTSRGDVVRIGYFESFLTWNYALADSYYEGDPNNSTFYVPQSRARTGPAQLHYACAYIATPEYWNPTSRLAGTQQLRPTQISSARFPAAKSLFSAFDKLGYEFPNDLVDRGANRSLVPLGVLDGSARSIPLNRLLPEYSDGDGEAPGSVHRTQWPPALHTIDGIHGRDFHY